MKVVWRFGCGLIGAAIVSGVAGTAVGSEPTMASESAYESDVPHAPTSEGLSKADLAWHALNTFGWNCDEVVERGELVGDYYVITCFGGLQLRVYPRAGQNPRITNIEGGFN